MRKIRERFGIALGLFGVSLAVWIFMYRALGWNGIWSAIFVGACDLIFIGLWVVIAY